MAYLSFPSVCFSGIAACVPKEIEYNSQSELLSEKERDNIIASTGISEKRVAPDGVCTSDLCFSAAEKLIKELKWDKSEIQALVFVSQTPDYILPATACVLQDRLGLPSECLSYDVSLGCSGWVYGLMNIASLVSTGYIKKALMLCGDLTTRTQSYRDKTSYPLFGDAGSCTAIEYDPKAIGFKFHLATDGSGKDAIIIPSGGYRNPITKEGLEFTDYGEGKVMTDLHARLDGMSVFSFAITKAPKSIKALCKEGNIDIETIDCFTFHQANLFLNETIRKKLKLPKEKVPYSLEKYANSSSGTIPVTLVTERRKKLMETYMRHIGCAFGVGLSWGSVYFETNKIVVPELIEY